MNKKPTAFFFSLFLVELRITAKAWYMPGKLSPAETRSFLYCGLFLVYAYAVCMGMCGQRTVL